MGHYALTAGDLRSASKQQEEVQHSHPLSLRSPPTSYTNLSHTDIENTHTHIHPSCCFPARITLVCTVLTTLENLKSIENK